MANPKTKNILISMMIVMSSAFLFGSILLFGRVAYAQTDSTQIRQPKGQEIQGDGEVLPPDCINPEDCKQNSENMGDEDKQTEAVSEEEVITSTPASAGLSITKESYSYTGYADNKEVVSQAIFVDRYNQTTSIGTITVESNNTTRINTGIYSTGHTFFEQGGDVLGGAFFADLKQNTYILPKIGASVNVSGTNVFALGNHITILNKNNVFVYNNDTTGFAPQNSDVFYINATEGLGINGASSKKGINVHGGVNVGEVNVTKSCVDNMSMGLQYNAGVMGIAKQSPGCMVGCRSNNISLADFGKWYLIDQSEVCKQWCRSNAQYCKTDNPVEENRTSTPAQCTGFDIKANMKKCDSQDALLGNFKDITFIGYLTEACPLNANEIANPCAYTCKDKYRVQSGACVYDPNRSCGSWTVNYNCNGGSPVAGYSLTQTPTNKSLTLLTGGCSKESENKKLIGWSSSSSATEVEYGLGSGLTLSDTDCSKTLYAVYECMEGFLPDGSGGCVKAPDQPQCATRKYMCDNNGRRFIGTNTGHDAINQKYIRDCGDTKCDLCDEDSDFPGEPSTLHNGACAKGPKYKRTCINQKSVCINETTNQPVDDKQCDQWSRPICNGPTPMTCMGTLPANAELWNTNAPTNNTTNYTYSATQTLLACRYKCNSGYTYDGEKCEKGPKYKRTCVNQKSVCINETTNQPVDDKECDQWSRPNCNGPTPMTCMGTLPANAELWNTNAPTNNTTNYTYSATQTSLACRYKCNSGYTYDGEKCEKDGPINIKITCKQNKTNESWSSTTYTADKPVPFDIFVGHEILIYDNNKLQTFQGNVIYNINSEQTKSDGDQGCYAHVGGSYNNGTYYGSMLKMGESFISTKKIEPICSKIENKSLTLNEISGDKKYIITLEDCAEPICGTTLLSNYSSRPSDLSLCDVGTASNRSDKGTFYSWKCTLPGGKSKSCRVSKKTGECQGTIPQNATLVAGSDLNLTANATRTLYASIGDALGKKCAYLCNYGYYPGINNYYTNEYVCKNNSDYHDTLRPGTSCVVMGRMCVNGQWECSIIPGNDGSTCRCKRTDLRGKPCTTNAIQQDY